MNQKQILLIRLRLIILTRVGRVFPGIRLAGIRVDFFGNRVDAEIRQGSEMLVSHVMMLRDGSLVDRVLEGERLSDDLFQKASIEPACHMARALIAKLKSQGTV